MDKPTDLDKVLKELDKQNRKELRQMQTKDLHRYIFMNAYMDCKGNSIAMAAQLGMTRASVWRFKKKYGLPTRTV